MADEEKTYELLGKDGKYHKVKASSPEEGFDKLDANPSGRSGLQTARAAAGEYLQGVPGVAAYVQPAAAGFRSALGLGKQGSDYDAQLAAIKGADASYRKDNPGTAMALRMAGTASAAAPLMPMASAIAGPGLVANMGAQGLVGMGMGGLDSATKEHATGTLGKEGSGARIAENAAITGLLSTLGPVAGKLRTPGRMEIPNPNYTNAAAKEGAVLSKPKPMTIEDQIKEAKSLAAPVGFDDLLKSKPYAPSGGAIEEAAANAARNAQTNVKPVFVPPSEATRDAVTHGIGATAGALIGHADPATATLAALLGHQVAPYAQQLGGAAMRSVGLHPEKYWNNKFMIENPGVQDILNILGQSGAGEYAKR